MKKLILFFAVCISFASCTNFKNCTFYSSTIYTNIGSNANQNRIAEIRARYYAPDTANYIQVETVDSKNRPSFNYVREHK